MTTDAERLQLIPTSPDTSWLFWMTLCFGSFLAIFAPYRFCSGALQLIDRDGLTLTSVGLYFMAALSGLMGLRWCVLFILSYAKMSRHDRELRTAARRFPAVCIHPGARLLRGRLRQGRDERSRAFGLSGIRGDLS